MCTHRHQRPRRARRIEDPSCRLNTNCLCSTKAQRSCNPVATVSHGCLRLSYSDQTHYGTSLTVTTTMTVVKWSGRQNRQRRKIRPSGRGESAGIAGGFELPGASAKLHWCVFHCVDCETVRQYLPILVILHSPGTIRMTVHCGLQSTAHSVDVHGMVQLNLTWKSIWKPAINTTLTVQNNGWIWKMYMVLSL